MREIQQMIANYVADRPLMFAHNQDNHRMLTLLLGEVAELSEVLGDKENLGHELADVVWLAISMAVLNDIDLDNEIRTKGARNHLKRQSCDWQEGDYKTQDRISRQKWADNGGDDEFYGV